MYTALYRRYRPGTFDEMVGQEHIVKILKNQIQSGNISHAYLFCGTRGTGKTTAARIFAKGVNCLSEGAKPCGQCENCVSIQNGVFFDVIEIDAASNNGVDNIRELRESVKYPPAAGLCKVYIIDEVHMLSASAFNALLKTLEEPPEHVIFILATTEPHKLPPTILSRCLRLDFRRVPEPKIRERLSEICQDQGISFEDSALSLIAANGDGSVRDSLSIMEQCLPVAGEILTRAAVVEVLGTAGEDVFLEITESLSAKDTAATYRIIDRLAADGKDMRQFIRDWTLHFRNLMMGKFAEKLEDILDMSCENAEKVRAQGEGLSMGFITQAITELSEAENKARFSPHPRTVLELAVLKLAEPEVARDTEALIRRISDLEKKLEEISIKGIAAPAPAERTAVKLDKTEKSETAEKPAAASTAVRPEAEKEIIQQPQSENSEPRETGGSAELYPAEEPSAEKLAEEAPAAEPAAEKPVENRETSPAPASEDSKPEKAPAVKADDEEPVSEKKEESEKTPAKDSFTEAVQLDLSSIFGLGKTEVNVH